MTKYRELFRIDLIHSFYDNEVCTGLALSPTFTSQRLLNKHQCIFRQEAGGCLVLIKDVDGGASSAVYSDVEQFSFEMTAKQPDFLTITELQVDEAELAKAIIHVSNRRQTNDAISKEDLLAVWNNNVIDQNAYDETSKIVTVPFGEEVWSASSPSGQDKLGRTQPRLADEGHYRLLIDNNIPLDFYWNQTSQRYLFGVVDIFPERDSTTGTVTDWPSCEIRLQNRETIWRYIVHQKTPGLDLNASKVVDRQSQVTFSPPTQETIGGKLCWVFESHQPIPFRELHRNQYDLVLPANGQSQTPESKIVLPQATSASLTTLEHQDGTKLLCSNIYVYL